MSPLELDVRDDDDVLLVVHPDYVAQGDQRGSAAAGQLGRRVRVVTSEALLPAAWLLLDAVVLRRLNAEINRVEGYMTTYQVGGLVGEGHPCSCAPCTARRHAAAGCDGCSDLGVPCPDHDGSRTC